MGDSSAFWLLFSIIFLPAVMAIVVACLPSRQTDAIRYFTLGVTIVVFALTLTPLLAKTGAVAFDVARGDMQATFNVPWIPTFDIEYFTGMDGISFPLMVLTSFVCVCAMGASWSIDKHVKGYCILFLLLETGMLGCFLALDFFLFYVFWEVMLLPMYFLIGIWGGPRREYAAIKFFLYTLVGSVLMLVAILMLYFSSDLRTLAEKDFRGELRDLKWSQMHVGAASQAKIGLAAKAVDGDPASRLELLRIDQDVDSKLSIEFVPGDAAAVDYQPAEHRFVVKLPPEGAKITDVAAAFAKSEEAAKVVVARAASGSASEAKLFLSTKDYENKLDVPAYSGPAVAGQPKVHSFNLLALAAMGQQTDLFSAKLLVDVPLVGGRSLQWWAFLLLFIGFIIKVPSVPVHTWLPDAHVEAPTPISMILAGVLLKLGGYGIVRICYPICPDGGYDLAYFVCGLGVVSMVYGALAALSQKDFKRMVAYSSVSHMGYVLLGLGVWSATKFTGYESDYWKQGITGAMFQMIGHGVSSPGMFFMVGIIYERVHHRNLDEFGGLFAKMPAYTALAMGIFFAGLGLPGLCGFWGEVWVVLAVWKFSPLLAIVSAAVVVLTAGYILWAIQRVYLGAEYKGPHGDHIHPSDLRENVIGGALLFLCILFGVFPHLVVQYMDATVTRQAEALTSWTRVVKEAPSAAASAKTPVEKTEPMEETAIEVAPSGDRS